MRTAHKVWAGVAAATFVLVAAVDLSSSASTPTTPPQAVAAPAAAPAAAAPVSDTVTVTRVIDGDTLEVTGGRRVRLLGVDACEANTAGGRRASDELRTLVDGQLVTLTQEPGVDRDRYGRELRYVTTSSGDLGSTLVTQSHTGVYKGRNDASPAYLAELRRLDGPPRQCSDPSPDEPAATGGGDTDVHVDEDRNHRDGALTGGYCRRKWWC